MSRHNYTNPAFCQQNEFYEERSDGTIDIISTTPSKMHRSESTRSFQKPPLAAQRNVFQRVHSERQPKQLQFQQRELPPKPGPKPRIVEGSSNNNNNNGPRYGSITSISTTQTTSGKFALVPVEELTSNNKGRYAVVPESEIEMISAARIARSQDHLDRIVSSPVDELDRHNLSADQFTSLPPMINNASSTANITTPGRLVSAFSTDFGSKSFVLYDQKSMQRYEVVPTEENEELVDPNHEIIQMQNGRAHRYAMIPADDQEETSMNNPPYATIKDRTGSKQNINHRSPVRYIPPPNSGNMTPRKNPIATQKLHELLSTPQKQLIRQQSTTPRSTPVRVRPPAQPVLNTPKKHEFTPQKLEYEQVRRTTSQMHLEARTTAVISPRLQSQSIYSETTTTNNSMFNKSWNSIQTTEAAGPATVGAISLMLVLCGILNAGLSLYLTSNNGRSYFLDTSFTNGLACLGLGLLGFKSRQCSWLPNRNYISGYLLVTVFSILNCCGLLALLILNPFPGFPQHDVISGIILGLSSITLVFISLGVVSSRWCRSYPPDARIEPV
uniref:CSON015121 protein n=1 Tax=Culicoides sonorensis TaxID=179676 RepID=A0A336MCV0_CULSO